MKSLGVRGWGGRVGWVLDKDFSCVVYHLSLWKNEGLEGFGSVLLLSGRARRFYLSWVTGEFGPCTPSLWGSWRISALHHFTLQKLEDFTVYYFSGTSEKQKIRWQFQMQWGETCSWFMPSQPLPLCILAWHFLPDNSVLKNFMNPKWRVSLWLQLPTTQLHLWFLRISLVFSRVFLSFCEVMHTFPS